MGVLAVRVRPERCLKLRIHQQREYLRGGRPAIRVILAIQVTLNKPLQRAHRPLLPSCCQNCHSQAGALQVDPATDGAAPVATIARG